MIKFINLKNLIILDIVIVLLLASALIFGRNIYDFINNYPHKAVYQTMNRDDNNLYEIGIRLGKSNKKDTFVFVSKDDEAKIKKFTILVESKFEELYGVKPSHNPDDLGELQKMSAGYHNKRLHMGDIAINATYFGGLIKENSQARWAYENRIGRMVLTDGKNNTFDVFIFVFDQLTIRNDDFEKVYHEWVEKFGAKQ